MGFQRPGIADWHQLSLGQRLLNPPVRQTQTVSPLPSPSTSCLWNSHLLCLLGRLLLCSRLIIAIDWLRIIINHYLRALQWFLTWSKWERCEKETRHDNFFLFLSSLSCPASNQKYTSSSPLHKEKSWQESCLQREKKDGSVTQSSQAQLLCLERAGRIWAETRYLSPSSGPTATFLSLKWFTNRGGKRYSK